ncbi:hypothetical protein [Asanoa siamensis]|uniref:Uncharacterized protein n=1 Tax=Asanoa siamensis TaxID=926357 RepID=A0ABQ4CV60_9ACTN|nr:hypothetical protein [Asanoa siamensis]GIF75182.1 hypothetical protein Asi02nite_47000 [Asanoa siamensis]
MGHPVAAGWQNGGEQEAVMAHGEADPGCVEADNDPSRTTDGPTAPALDDPAPGRQIRRVCADPKADRGRDCSDAPDHVADPTTNGPIQFGRAPACRSERPGWAGAHRHGAVRPRRRASRKERPPDRWC